MTSKAITNIPSMIRNGSNTKNQATEGYPALHKYCKNQHQSAIKTTFMIIVNGLIRLDIAINMEKADRRRYRRAGLHNFILFY